MAFVMVGLNGSAQGLWAPGDAWMTSKGHPTLLLHNLTLSRLQLLESVPWSDPTSQTDAERTKTTPQLLLLSLSHARSFRLRTMDPVIYTV